MREQLVEPGQRLVGALEAPARIARRHIVTPADEFPRLIRLHRDRHRPLITRRRRRRPEFREHARHRAHRFAILRLKTKRLPVGPQSPKAIFTPQRRIAQRQPDLGIFRLRSPPTARAAPRASFVFP